MPWAEGVPGTGEMSIKCRSAPLEVPADTDTWALAVKQAGYHPLIYIRPINRQDPADTPSLGAVFQCLTEQTA